MTQIIITIDWRSFWISFIFGIGFLFFIFITIIKAFMGDDL